MRPAPGFGVGSRLYLYNSATMRKSKMILQAVKICTKSA